MIIDKLAKKPSRIPSPGDSKALLIVCKIAPLQFNASMALFACISKKCDLIDLSNVFPADNKNIYLGL